MHMDFLAPQPKPSPFHSPTPSQRASKDSSSPWEKIRHTLQASLSQEEFAQWIEPLKSHAVSDKEILILVPNLVFCQVMLDQYLDRIEEIKSELSLDDVLVRFEVEASFLAQKSLENPLSESAHLIPDVIEPEPYAAKRGRDSRPISSDEQEKESFAYPAHKTSLNLAYIFPSFVRGPSNQFAHASCAAVADAPGRTYNPLFIYGSTGLGKTHLLHAIGNRIHEKNPAAVVTYISSERFMNEMITCIRFNKMYEFRQKYRHCDVFLVDDIQFISNKERTQEEFFHTFNSLYEAKKQIVITSDTFPQDIPVIEDRLRNRFQWGLIADIQPPDTEHRIAILMSKAEQLGLKVDEEVALYIANHAKRNVRELEGALHRIAAFAALQGRPINIDLATETFQNVLGEPQKRLTIETVQKIVADHYKIKISDLKSKKRHRALTLPRQVAMFLSRSMTQSSFPELGEKFGGKDHTTVMHAVRKIDKDRLKDLDLKVQIDSIQRQLEQML